MPPPVSTNSLFARLIWALSLLPLAACDGPTRACENPRREGNIVTCDGDWNYRVATDACAEPAPGDCTMSWGECAVDADCGGRFGRCMEVNDPEWGLRCGCDFGCVTDADCAYSICICGARGGTCVWAYCETGADCPPGMLCATADEGCGSIVYACQTPADECVTSSSCDAPSQCLYVEDERRYCRKDECWVP